MSPPSGACEITESADDLDLKTMSLAKIKTKPEAVAATENTNRSPDIRNHLSRPMGPSRLGAVDLAHRSAMKRPIRPPGGASSSSSAATGAGGALDTASLKQALRKLTIVQASEMAAMKRLSKPTGVSSGSEAGTIQRLYASVVVQAGGGSGQGQGNPSIQVSVMPEEEEKIVNKSCAKVVVGSSRLQPPTEFSGNSKRTVSPRLTKPRVRDIIASTSPRTEKEPSPRATRPVTKQKPKPSEPAVSSSSNTCPDSNKPPGVSPRLAKPPLQTKTTPKKGMPTTSSSSIPKDPPNKSHETNKTISATPTKKPVIQRKEPGCPASNAASLKPVEQKSYPLPRPGTAPAASSNRPDARAIVMKRVEFPRNLEKGESSQSSKSSMGDYSSSTSISGDSNQSGSSVVGTRPHMSSDVRWASIRSIEMRNGGIGLMNFKLLKRLGCGDIGTVYLAELCGSGCLFALKVMDNEFLARRKKMMRALTEREILQMLDHPFLPTLYTYFTTDNLSCLVMEYCPGGDLHVLRQKQAGRHFSEPSARFYVAEVLLALEYLHMLGVVYRDLKPENILVREDGHIMLSDFDLSLRCSVNPFLVRASSVSAADCARPSGACASSGCIDPLCLHSSWAHSSCFTPRLLSSATPRTRKLKPDQTTHGSRSLPQLVVEPTEARSNSFVGTHEYLAPEIIKGEGHGSSVDWWTFGIFLYELLYGKTPFKGSGNEETLANVISQNLRFPDSPAVSFRARDLIRGLLVKEPENRLGSRRGAAEIKRHPFFEGLNWALIRCATPPEMPKPCDYGSIVAEVLNKKEEKAMEFKEKGNNVEFELF